MTCATSELADALRLAKPALSINNILPIMQSYCFTGSCVFAYNDFYAIGVELSTPFTGAIPGEALRKCVDTFRGDKVTFEQDEENLLVACARSKVTFVTMPESAFPLDPEELRKTPKASLVVNRAFAEGLSEALLSVDTQFFFDVYGSVALALEKGQPLTLYSTDDQTLTRVSLQKLVCPSLPGFTRDVLLLPNDFCKQFVNLYKHFFDGHDGEVTLHLTDEYLYADFGEGFGWIMVELPDADVIPYAEVFDDAMPDTRADEWATVDDELLAILSRADALHKLNVSKHMTQQTLLISRGDDDSEALFVQETGSQGLADTWQGGIAPDTEVAVDPKLMLRAAKSMGEVHWASGSVIVFRSGEYITHLVSLG